MNNISLINNSQQKLNSSDSKIVKGIDGIDFGKTYSKISYVTKGIDGFVTQEFKDSTSESNFPSILYFDKSGKVSFGNLAYKYMYDKSSIIDCKRLIGQNYDNPILET